VKPALFTHIALLMGLACPCSAQLHGKQATDGLVGVCAYSENKPLWTGSGFWIDKNHVITAKHCTGPQMQVKLGNGQVRTATLAAEGGRFSDWAVLKVHNATAPVTIERQTGKRAGNTAYCYGDYRITGGTVKVLRGHVMGRWCSAPVVVGFSGGPVVDESGKAIGIVSQATGWFVPIGQVRW
jgi:hypothetical protein